MNNTYGFSYMDTGLGNMIWSWAYCYIWCKDNQIEIIAPFWSFPHPKKWLRERKIDRWYAGYFHNEGYISGLHRLALLATGQKVDYRSIGKDLCKIQLGSSKTHPLIISFTDLYDFNLLLGRHNEVSQELARITRKKYFPHVDSQPFISVHVRLGDFKPQDPSSTGSVAPNTRLPIDWYVSALRKVREVLGTNIRAVVFSDGSDSELSLLLQEDNTLRSTNTTAITDIWTMTKSAAIIASRSSFSLWGTYLGQVPTIYYPGARPCDVSIVKSGKEFDLEPEWGIESELPESFIQGVVHRL